VDRRSVSGAERREALRAVAARQGLDAVLITNLLNVRYLTGFTGSNGALLVLADGSDLFGTDGRYTTQAGIQVPDVELVEDRATVAALAALAVRRGVARLGFESHDLTVDGLAALE
jgi:Xaa-Pro aminopeptidase